MKRIGAQLLLEAINVDRECGLRMLELYRKEWVAVVEKPRSNDFASLAEYYEYRENNFGNTRLAYSLRYWLIWVHRHARFLANGRIQHGLEPK
jgi:hypothetical protein